MADIDSIIADMQAKVEGKKAIGKIIAFNVKDQGVIMVHAVEEPVRIEKVAEGTGDVTITISGADLAGLLDGSVNGQSLMMTGRAKMSGNPAVVMKMRDLFF
jgi:putative sterol carrier protein